jgi:hypothetical protein
MVCGGYHLRVIQVLLSNYPELHNLAINPGFVWWFSSRGYLDLKEKSKCFKNVLIWKKCRIKLALCKLAQKIH